MLPRSFTTRYGSVLADVIPLAVFLAGILSFLIGAHLQSFPLDDAWIHRVYSRAFAFGNGFAYNEGAQEAGATSPLWVIVTAPVHWLESLDPRAVIIGVMGIGSALGLISILLFRRIVARETGSLVVATIAASLLALEPRLLFASLSGMETTLLIALWLAGLHALLTRRWLWFALWFGLAPVTRPESVLLLPICVLALLRYGRDLPARRKWASVALLIVPCILWALSCRQTTGHWLPNTYYLKAHTFQLTSKAMTDAWQIVTGHGFASVFVSWIGVALGGGWLVKQKRALTLAFLGIAPLLYLIATVGSRDVIPGGYYWTRWIDPVSVLFSALFALGYATLLGGALNLWFSRPVSARVRAIVAATAALGLIICIPSFAASFQDRRGHLATDSRSIYEINVKSGLWIKANTRADDIVGVGDAGAIRYFGGRHTIDLAGINNHTITFHPEKRPELMLQCDWLAIFPRIFQNFHELIEREFALGTGIGVELEEYTICDCPEQIQTVIYRRRKP